MENYKIYFTGHGLGKDCVNPAVLRTMVGRPAFRQHWTSTATLQTNALTFGHGVQGSCFSSRRPFLKANLALYIFSMFCDSPPILCVITRWKGVQRWEVCRCIVKFLPHIAWPLEDIYMIDMI